MKKRVFFLILCLLLLNTAYSNDSKDLKLGWVGFLNLPKKIQKEDGLVDVKTPRLWEKWSRDKNYQIEWFAKPKKDYQSKIHLYLLLDQSKTKTRKLKRRDMHLNLR